LLTSNTFPRPEYLEGKEEEFAIRRCVPSDHFVDRNRNLEKVELRKSGRGIWLLGAAERYLIQGLKVL